MVTSLPRAQSRNSVNLVINILPMRALNCPEAITPGVPPVVEVAQYATDADVCELRPVTWQEVINTVKKNY